MSARPLLAAHRVEDAAAAAQWAAAGADLLEIDVHLRRGVLEVRHPRWLGPVLWDREGVRRARSPDVTLPSLLAALPPRREPMLDLKGGPPAVAGAALGAARAAGHARVTVTSRRWSLLDGLAGERNVRLAYSAADRRELARLRARRLPPGAAVCARRDLLDPRSIAALTDDGVLLMVWDVRTQADARALVASGVGGLVLDDPELLAALAGG